MRRNHTSRLIAFFLSVLMLFGTFVPLSALEEDIHSGQTDASIGTTTLQEISDALNTISYTEYSEKYAEASRATKEVVVDVTKYDAETTTAEVKVISNMADDFGNTQAKALYMGDTGTVTWKVNVPQTGKYAMEIVYTSESTKTNSIERMLYINGKVPFSQARYLLLTKNWVHEYNTGDNVVRLGNEKDGTIGIFNRDITGNELRPSTGIKRKWAAYQVKDSNGYYQNPYS